MAFVKATINPALHSLSPEELEFRFKLLNRECDNLLDQVDRLEMLEKSDVGLKYMQSDQDR